MQLRHILPADNLYAVYFVDQPPYAVILKCQHRASVRRKENEEDKDSEYLDEIIGFVLDRTIVPADEVSEGTTFAFYVDRSEFIDVTPNGVDDSRWKTYIQNVLSWGQQAYRQRHPEPTPEVITDIASENQPRRKRRARG